MKFSFSGVISTAATVIMCCQTLTVGQTTAPSIDTEIVRLRKELAQTQLDCQRVRQEIEKDQKDFEAYRKRISQSMKQAAGQLDTVKAEISRQGQGNDSLAGLIANLQAQRRQIELSQEEFRQRLVALCGTVVPAVHQRPPLVMAPTASALSLLTNDLTTRAVDNVEGCTRLGQLLTRLDDISGGIQIAQESSPVPDIRGTVYRLRIGSFFEALVELKGEKSAVFTGWGADGSPNWQVLESASASQSLLTAINIREGKALPAFVDLPFVSVAAAANGGAQ